MTELTPATTAEVRTTLDALTVAQLPPATWAALPEQLDRLAAALDHSDEHEVRAALVPLSRAVFEAKVRTRLGPRRPSAAVVIPAKRTPALPVVGAVCAATLLALGWQLGGGLVLAGTALLALLVLAVAVAGTHANVERAQQRRARTPEEDPRTPPPAGLRSRLEALRARSPEG